MKFSAISPKSMSRPIAKIVIAIKTGTTTTTITTDVPHGLSNTNYVTIKGIRDTTNFASFATPAVVTVVSANQFTVVMGTAVTATSYGGAVILANGQIDQPGIIAQTVQSINIDGTNQLLTIVGSSTWAGLNIGEYAYLYGCRDNTTGADMLID